MSSAGLPALLACLALLIAPGGALGASATASATKAVRYHGDRLVVPASWPVYRLASDPTACVRFNRHALYLGHPGADQRCPADPAGRTEAVLVAPLVSQAPAGGGQVLPLPSTSGSVPAYGSATQRVDAKHGVVVTATWSRRPSVIERALGVHSLPTVTASPGPARPVAIVTKQARIASAQTATAKAASAKAATASRPGAVFTGEGFDACSTPSSSAMSAWGASPYRAVGVYIGGTNMACSQPNLTSGWVTARSAAGWHLIPIYVGLQAPSNDCGCASISAASAGSEGKAAARDAIAKAQAIGLAAGNPIYSDTEGYTTSSSNTSAVLAFLAGWTTQLHAGGYKSGVYSSAASGIRDLASRMDSGYTEPDDIWIANWNGAKNTYDSNVPSGDWAAHQRLHQYEGAHNETYRGVTINIDGDYVDGSTAAAGTVTSTYVAASPSVAVSPEAGGAIDLRPSWSGTAGVSSWRVLGGGTPTSLSAVARPFRAGNPQPIVVKSAFAYFQVQALGSAGQTLGTTPIVATRSHLAIVGQSAFVPARGLGGLPIGCFKTTQCAVSTTVSVGGTTIARTGRENIAVGGGIAYFRLTAAGRKLLTRASHHRLGVTATVRDSSGLRVTRKLNLVPYTTSGKSKSRSVKQSQPLRIIGTTDFVANGWSGGVLAVCAAATPCRSSVTVSSGRTTIAHANSELLGAGELGYLSFKLTVAGHRLLLNNRGNQLVTRLAVTTAPTAVPVTSATTGSTDTSSAATTTPGATGTSGGAGATGLTPSPSASAGATSPAGTTRPAGTTSSAGTRTPTTATAQLALALFR